MVARIAFIAPKIVRSKIAVPKITINTTTKREREEREKGRERERKAREYASNCYWNRNMWGFTLRHAKRKLLFVLR
jgi:hypothetical protein